MSESTSSPVSVGNVFLLFPDKPDYYVYTSVYDPTQTYPAGSKLTVPPIGSLIGGDALEDNVLYRVTGIASNYALTLEPIFTKYTNDGYGLTSVVSYGNVLFRAYYDSRSTPYTLTIDRVVFYGGAPSTYQIIRYPNDSTKSTVVSRYYDESGAYVGTNAPMLRLEQNQNTWYCTPCNITFIPDDDEELLIKVFSETGALIATCSVFAKQSDIVNDALVYRPKITSLTIGATQMQADGQNLYIYEKQSLDDLDITGTLLYSDGQTRQVLVDNVQTFLFGKEDFVASYAGMRQQMMLKYFLTYNESLANTVTSGDVDGGAISTTFTVTVIPNETAVPIKLLIVPVWNVTQNQYVLEYYYYSTAHNKFSRVTPYVTIRSGTFVGNNYISYQSFSFGLDMNQADPTTYPSSTTYLQAAAIKLQPYAALVRYMIKDSMSAPLVYGADSSTSRRPVMYYDSTAKQYFIPSGVFINSQAVLNSFYYNLSPPYDPTVETQPPTPTHFTVRNLSGVMLTPEPIALTNYVTAFSLIGDLTGQYVGSVLIVEFIQQVSVGNNLILFGAPVDVYAGTYIG